MPKKSPPHHAGVYNGRLVEVRRRRSYVECLVFAGETAEGEPVAEWEMPIQLRYDLRTAAQLAERQTDRA